MLTYEGVVEVTESGDVKFDATDFEDGNYTLVVISYYEGEAQNYATATLKYTTAGKESWAEMGQGVYAYGVESFAEDGSVLYSGQETATLYQSESEPTKFKLSPWTSSTTGLIFTVASDGTITVDGVETGEEFQSYGVISASDLVTKGVVSAGKGYDSNKDGNTYSFYLAYHVEAGNLAFQLDTFTLDAETAAKMRKAAKKHYNNKNKVSLMRTLKKVDQPVFSLK